MYMRYGITAGDVFWSSWRPVVIAGLWASLIVHTHSNLGLKFVVLPALPISTIGIAISLYLGFKTSSAYNRWWEAREIWGGIVNNSRTWSNQACNLLTLTKNESALTSETRILIRRHLAWVNALAYQLRKTSRLTASTQRHIFDYRNTKTDNLTTNSPGCYECYLSEEEVQDLRDVANPATHIIHKQGAHLRELLKQGACERIKNTPFPRQITYFGRIFSWIFIVLLPFALYDSFEDVLKEHFRTLDISDLYLLPMVLFTMTISWLFYMLQKVGESCEDPFESGPTDVPISALTRVIEIDLLQILGEENIPEPIQPRAGVLY